MESGTSRKHTDIFDAELRIFVAPILTEAAQWTNKTSVVGLVCLQRDREKDATSMVIVSTDFADYFGIAKQVWRPTTTDAARSVAPVLVNILPKCELRSAALLCPYHC